MTLVTKLKTILLAVAVGTIGFAASERVFVSDSTSLVSKAEATVGRPLTPVSVAGVARRSARR